MAVERIAFLDGDGVVQTVLAVDVDGRRTDPDSPVRTLTPEDICARFGFASWIRAAADRKDDLALAEVGDVVAASPTAAPDRELDASTAAITEKAVRGSEKAELALDYAKGEIIADGDVRDLVEIAK